MSKKNNYEISKVCAYCELAECMNDKEKMLRYIKGVVNLRGKIVPIMDVRIRFGKPEKQPDEQTCFIVVDMNVNLIILI